MTDDAGPILIDAEFKADAPRRYAQLRAKGPVHRVKLMSGLEPWAVVTYPEALEALTHPLLRKDTTPAEETLARLGFLNEKPGVGIGGNMLTSDPPDHTRLRRLTASAFSSGRAKELGPRIQQITDSLIDAMIDTGGELDLVEAFTGPLPMTVICELLGVPEGERSRFRVWTVNALSSVTGQQYKGMLNLNRYLADLIERKRQEPQDDLLSALIAIQDEDDGRLSPEELLGTAVLLIVAGHDTTVNLIGNAVLSLFHQPEQAEKLRARPELIPAAVEEFLRHDPPVEQTTNRYAAGDLVLGGQAIAKGDIVYVALGSAGRDAPQRGTADTRSAPDVLDVEREAARHIAFGHGIHHCLGAPLARLEATIAIGTLLRRLPALRLAVPRSEVPWTPAGIMRGPRKLPVRFDPVAPPPQ